MTVLLNPGPVVLSDRVRDALLKPDLCHREQEFVELQNKIRQDLLDVYNLPANEWAAILMTGSGTAAMEGMMTSFIPAHGKVLIIENGVYGERLTRIAGIHDIDHVSLHHEWGEEIDLDKLEAELQYHEELSHVAVVQHETTTGRLNNIEAIAEVCQRHNIAILLDGVSSFGAEEIKFTEWNIAACAATANKCLHAVPGTSFVIANRKSLELMQATPPRTLYLDLITYLKNQDADGTPFTQSVQTFYALSEALDELKDEGGWQQRRNLYRTRMNIVYEGFITLGIKPMLESSENSCVLNAFYLPDGIDYPTLHDSLKENGFVIYAGQGQFEKNIFRISCMGEMANEDLDNLVSIIEEILK